MSFEWRFELRIQLSEQLSDAELDQLMAVTSRSDWDVTRDPIGIALVTYGPSEQPGETLRLLWAEATSWLEAQGRTGYVAAGQVMTEALAEEQALRPDTPELLSTPDVAELLGVSRQRVHQLHTERSDFPAPYARLGSGPIWARPAIEAFDRSWTRKPGRPARVAG